MAKRARIGNAESPPGRLRIVAGIWRSRRLEIAAVPGLRPTSERVRETLFNWLAPSIEGSRCLDLFAGTGALGLEALSRGAREAVFVEKAPRAVATLERNIRALGADNARVVAGDAMEFVQSATQLFDVVFVDPPFADDRLASVCSTLDRSGLLAPGAKVYLEQDRAARQPGLPAGWKIEKNKTAGNVRYMLVSTAGENSGENH